MFNPAMLNGAIPGMSLTQEPGNMPWENPPELTTIGEVMDFILEKTFTVEIENLILPILEEGGSVEALAQSIATSGTMNGRFSLDLAFLVNPYIRELIKYMADSADVEYIESYKDGEDKDIIPYRILKGVIKEIHEEQDTPKLDVLTSMPKDLESKGLMSRLNKEN